MTDRDPLTSVRKREKKKEKCIEEDMTAIFECVGGDIGPNE